MTGFGSIPSLLGFLLFAQEVLLLTFLLVRGVRNRNSETVVFAPHTYAAPAAVTNEKVVGEDGPLDDDTRFLFDVVARQNEGIIQTIDALDNGLVALAVGIIAIALFAADKWFDLDSSFRFAGFFFLVESAICTVIGYARIGVADSDSEEVVHLSDFAIDFVDSPGASTSFAILSIARSAQGNVVLRRVKRILMMIATFSVVLAAGCIIAGRAFGKPTGH